MFQISDELMLPPDYVFHTAQNHHHAIVMLWKARVGTQVWHYLTRPGCVSASLLLVRSRVGKGQHCVTRAL